jgi:uncharacterized membrane protein
VWNTEKPMDMAFINAINRSRWFPPHDPWLSGYTINYYYLGHLMMAWLIRIAGIDPWVGFNLDVAAVYGLCVTGIFAASSAFTKGGQRLGGYSERTVVVSGILASLIGMVLGNLDGAVELLLKPQPLINFDWWSPSRIIANTINEFPFFSFLLADLHAHMIAAPFDLLCLAFSLQLGFGGLYLLRCHCQDAGDAIKGAETHSRASSIAPLRLRLASLAPFSHCSSPIARSVIPGPFTSLPTSSTSPSSSIIRYRSPVAIIELIAAAVLYGSLYAINGWDFPTQLGIGLLCLTVWWMQQPEKITIAPLVASSTTLVILAFLAFLPFYLHFVAPEGGIGLVTQHPDLIQYFHDYLIIYGLYVWIIAPAFVFTLHRLPFSRMAKVWFAITLVLILIILAPSHEDGVLLLLGSSVFAFTQVVAVQQPQHLRLWWLLVGIAIGLVSVGEVVYLRDVFAGGPDYRMNTIFKFGFQAWFVFAVLAGPAIFWSKHWMQQSSRPLWIAGLTFLMLAASVYTIAAPIARESGFRYTPTLNGLLWLQERSPGDVEAIEWLNRHVKGGAVIAEAVGADYNSSGYARVSTFTGLSSVIGWPGHEIEWGHEPGTRPQDVKTLYTTTNLAEAKAIIQRYHIDLIFVGSLEQEDYPGPGLGKFSRLGRVLFHRDHVTIYEVGPVRLRQ